MSGDCGVDSVSKRLLNGLMKLEMGASTSFVETSGWRCDLRNIRYQSIFELGIDHVGYDLPVQPVYIEIIVHGWTD